MSVTLTHIGRTPSQSQFDLDRFTEHYKCQMADGTPATADVVLTDPSVPSKGTSHPDFNFMFITDRHCQEGGDKASALDLVYTGCMKDDGAGNPILPPAKTSQHSGVMSASTAHLTSGLKLTTPVTAQYYAPTNEKSWFTFLGPATSGFAPDPTGDPEIIYIEGDTILPYGLTLNQIGQLLFVTALVSSFRDEEVVAGKFWRNLSSNQKIYRGSMLFYAGLLPGVNVREVNGGTGYTDGNVITVGGGGYSASINVTLVDDLFGGILAFTASGAGPPGSSGVLTAAGGSGSGATFVVVVVP